MKRIWRIGQVLLILAVLIFLGLSCYGTSSSSRVDLGVFSKSPNSKELWMHSNLPRRGAGWSITLNALREISKHDGSLSIGITIKNCGDRDLRVTCHEMPYNPSSAHDIGVDSPSESTIHIFSGTINEYLKNWNTLKVSSDEKCDFNFQLHADGNTFENLESCLSVTATTQDDM